MVSFLEIIDNPHQDVPLISVLRSPVFGFTPDRLAEIRGGTPGGDFYDAVAANGGADCAAFLEILDRLRLASRDMSVHSLIWTIYNERNLLGIFGAMDHGLERKENLIALSRHAEKFESGGYKGLFTFVTHLRRLLETDQAPVTKSASAAGGVRLMSIHKSKGLEFPIVILADLDHAFSRQDFDTAVLVHPEMGLGPRRVDLKRKIKYPTLARLAIDEKLRRENLSEEQRILYVAMTRPKEKLILVDSMYHAPGRLQKLAAVASCPVLPETVAAGKSFGDWLLLPLLCRPEAASLRAYAEAEVDELYTEDTSPWQVFIHDSEEFRQRPWRTAGGADETVAEPDFDPALLGFTYPYEKGTTVPAKVTATQLKGRVLDEQIAENTTRPPRLRSLTQPRFRQVDRGLTPAERGTATHLALQYLELSDPDVEGQLVRLREARKLTPEQAAGVDVTALKRFLASPLAAEIRGARKVEREFPFTLLIGAEELTGQAAAGDQILLQGVVDCFFETEEGITVVDFKTDRVRNGEELTRRAQHYRTQLETYSRALEQVMEKPVTRSVLYFLHIGEKVEL